MILFSFIFLDINYYLLTESMLQMLPPPTLSTLRELSPELFVFVRSRFASLRLTGRSEGSINSEKSWRWADVGGEERQKLVFISLEIVS